MYSPFCKLMFSFAIPWLSVTLLYVTPLILNVTVSFDNGLPCPSINLASNAFVSLVDFTKSVAVKTGMASTVLETLQSLYSPVIMYFPGDKLMFNLAWPYALVWRV